MSSLIGAIIWFMCIGAWLNHIITCFGQNLWGFLIAGALFPPLGILHGIYLWFA